MQLSMIYQQSRRQLKGIGSMELNTFRYIYSMY
ncbi:hypothetical protein ACP_3535 [Acidobacterium capsulatum ATCC 51196]|uniref:Uncharacterized protein n=1 Tax=Acidobacterium capsulatum (strain ATCC 51196 / DSM 11244 / BCRC 80197 / JCM 7670 / NBRC 15755 / NCIMB 13165 / 161) TaxID=240015 RepID=C1F7G8_ACIC5|nr:hypothetical protein ACP_3535 [Acidobacterium capsulatum ATCC 51196]